MKYIFATLVIAVFIFACNKDKYNTKPQITFKSVNETTIAKNKDLRFKLSVTDKEGDLTDSLFIYKISRNCNKDTVRFFNKMPTFPTNTNLEIPVEVNFTYGLQGNYPAITISSSCGNRNDSCSFKFIIKDKAGNKSDSVVSPEIVILK
jgi:hypothetical protein